MLRLFVYPINIFKLAKKKKIKKECHGRIERKNVICDTDIAFNENAWA